MNTMENFNEWVGKKIRLSLDGGMYYKGLVLSCGEDFLKIRDFRDKIVFIRIENVNVVEEWK